MFRSTVIFLSITSIIAVAGCSASKNTALNPLSQRFEQPCTSQKIMKGVYWLSCLGYDSTLMRNMSINVLDIDLHKAPVIFDFAWFNDQRATLSEIADTALAVAAINSAYFEKLNDGGYVSFHKRNGAVNQRVEVPPSHTRFWKHSAAFVQTGPKEFGFIAGNQRLYDSLEFQNIISSAPLLISDGIPVGKYVVTRKSGEKSDLESEHPDRHQAGRGPRTVYAKTADNHLLLITVDGRSRRAEGINAEELTDFLIEIFDATDAINMDGGGSVTMFVRGATQTGIVNYPSDQRKKDPENFTHHGQRRNGMALLLKPTRLSDRRRLSAMSVAPDTLAADYLDPKNAFHFKNNK